ncbi:bifunctional diaminohydroxyphosphoribosylaminopyrimidine deaminase/5-amino-6-(5-phosphoribosylamino)uracil reductase RibD [Stenotrophomonas koreensis]|uniref:bifunctional diaminohydroxyphosphoribosylaminopyrimidine deaminase/5-amino-6-(5-phosphoribosylamino)uracil reductase RibD n=1 Tax=Stenotrophomonas koreensis TaxID=266128 RepID=UPI0033916106
MSDAGLAFSAVDHGHMARALQLAERARFSARPNPVVGCVIAHGPAVVGEGFHIRAGGPHAEVHALRMAGERARGATAYVTLEPCAHYGRTPPCALALIQAGVARVVCAVGDPFDQVAGGGFELLRHAGIVVEVGLMAAAARELNIGFFTRIEQGWPFVRIKLATSLDGRTALADGASQWITGPDARADVQRWRARAGAVLTGAGTVLADDPRLDVRLDPAIEVATGLRVVLDAGLRSLARANVRSGPTPTLYLHAPQTAVPAGDWGGAQFAPVPLAADGRLDLAAVLALLAARGINEVHVEAGAQLCGALVAADLYDELLLYQAPTLLGDAARALLAGLAVPAMAQQRRLQLCEALMVGGDLRLRLRPRR